MQPANRRNRSTASSTAVAIAAISVVVHAVALVVISRMDRGSRTGSIRDDANARGDKPVEPSCNGDAVLASVARLAYCVSPFGGDAGECADTTLRDYHLGIADCDKQDLLVDNNHEDKQRDEPVQIALLDDAALAKLEPMPLLPLLDQKKQKAFEEKQQKKVEEKLEKIKKQENRRTPSAQVVEVTKPDVEIAPDKARYVSEFNTKVKKETVARGTTEKMIARPGPKELPAANKALKPPAPDTSKPDAIDKLKSEQANENGTGALAMRRPGPRETLPPLRAPGINDGSQEPVTADGLGARKGQRFTKARPRLNEPLGQEGSGATGRPKVPDLRPSEELLRRVIGGGSVDKLDGVKAGENTALNSKRWKFASFFNRMKRQVARNWHPDRVYLSRDPRGNVYGSKDRVTVLKVSLKRDGSISGIYITRGSGIDFLDDEAVRAFRAAQPFPNPPGGLAGGQSNLITFSFGFHFKVGSRRDRWKVFRYR